MREVNPNREAGASAATLDVAAVVAAGFGFARSSLAVSATSRQLGTRVRRRCGALSLSTPTAVTPGKVTYTFALIDVLPTGGRRTGKTCPRVGRSPSPTTKRPGLKTFPRPMPLANTSAQPSSLGAVRRRTADNPFDLSAIEDLDSCRENHNLGDYISSS
jgi:hypothetical protein